MTTTPASPALTDPDQAMREEPSLHSFCINPVGGLNIRAEGTDRFTTEAEAFAYAAWSRATIAILRTQCDQLAADLRKAREALRPFAALSFSFDGFSCDPATLVFRSREYGQWRSDHHSDFEKMIETARAALTNKAEETR
jgi:hypothetical protein